MSYHVAEIMNLRNLEKVLAREEEVKKRAIVHKSVYDGPQIRYLSKDGKFPLFISKHLECSRCFYNICLLEVLLLVAKSHFSFNVLLVENIKSRYLFQVAHI